jgi:hypothetical protein
VSLFNSLAVAAYNAVLFVPIVFFLTDRDITQYTALTQPAAYRITQVRVNYCCPLLVLMQCIAVSGGPPYDGSHHAGVAVARPVAGNCALYGVFSCFPSLIL